MCGKRLKVFLLSLVLVLFLFCLPCYSEVVLTDEEAVELQTEIEKSKKELTSLTEESQELRNELDELKLTLNEQRKYYEEQLREARAQKAVPWIIAGISTAITSGAIIALINK